MKNYSYYIILVVSIFLVIHKVQAQNTSYGMGAGSGGDYNTSIGFYAGADIVDEENVCLGHYAGKYSYEDVGNVLIGSYAGLYNEGDDNVIIGKRAGMASFGGSNVFIGTSAGYDNFYGHSNVFIGKDAGFWNIDSHSNVFIGTSAGHSSGNGSSNVFIGDSAGYYETGSHRLYIANSSTTTPLIYGEFNNQLIGINGKLGIGINNPNESLEIYRNSAIQVASQYGNSNTGSGAGNGFIVGIDTTGNGLIWNRENNFIRFGTNGSERIRINADGKVGIGVVNPDYELDVCGTIRAKEIIVDLEAGCDFVFSNDYNLMDLKELELFVKTHQHLPGIAPEKEMIEHGVNMKEMQMKLLQKIEELTLYTIELNKELENMQNRIKELEQK